MGEAISGVRVMSISRVAPAPSPAQASHLKVKLSYMDTPFVSIPPIQQLFLYELAGSDEFGAVVRRLKESLAATLALYLPLAGKLAYEEETGDLVVQCSDAGVAFYEAEAMGGGGMDVRRLAGDDAHDVPAFLSLAPEHDTQVLPAPVLRLQATRLGASGLALVLSFHHAVVDGVAVEEFKGSWASIYRGGKPLGPRGFGREAIDRYNADGKELARKLLNMVAPNLSKAMRKDDYMVVHSRLARWRFCLSADDIRLLKQRINEPASTFVAVVALAWTALVRSKGLALQGDDTAYLVFPLDLRSRFQPPVSEGYFGNCAIGYATSAIVGELLGETGLLHASRAIREAIKEAEKGPLAAFERWIEGRQTKKVTPSATLGVSGSPLFRLYDTADFGFGRPARAEYINLAQDGIIVLSSGERKGDVQVTVSLNPAHMTAFIANINCSPSQNYS